MKFADLLLDILETRDVLNQCEIGDPQRSKAIGKYLKSLETIDCFIDNLVEPMEEPEKESISEILSTKEKLGLAQELLSDVYYTAGESGDNTLESLMSVADSCIGEALDWLEK